jgi:hypothetical protein
LKEILAALLLTAATSTAAFAVDDALDNTAAIDPTVTNEDGTTGTTITTTED